jgi:hypothetical protein
MDGKELELELPASSKEVVGSATELQLASFKSYYPDLEYVQALTVDSVHAAFPTIDWNTVTPAHFLKKGEMKKGEVPGAQQAVALQAGEALQAGALDVSPCALAVGYVVFDCVCLAFGAIGVRSTVQRVTIEAIAEGLVPIMNQLTRAIRAIAEASSVLDQARGVFSILSLIYSGGFLGAVVSTFVGSLTWWQMILYGITGVGTIIAMLATDGAAFIAEVVVLLATFGFLVTDAVAAVQTCGSDDVSVASVMPIKKPCFALQTSSGNYLTVVDNGMGDATSSSIHTYAKQVGEWEKFTLVPIDAASKTFALKTASGDFLSAVDGGGRKGETIATDSTKIGPFESFNFLAQNDGTWAIMTTSGFYLTAVNGGGKGGIDSIKTDAKQIGTWETFTLVQL